MHRFGLLPIVLTMLLAVAACAGGPMAPTATAVPLAVTATPRPLPTRAAPTLPAETPTHSAETPAATATPTPSPAVPAQLSRLDDLLVERTVESFVSRLNEGKADSAFSLFATDAALESEAGQLLTGAAETEARLVKAVLLEIRRATASSYEARILLRWRGQGGESANQTLTATLVEQDGLWLIDGLSLGEAQVATPTPRAAGKRSGSSGGRTPALTGKLVFQTNSGGDVYIINADGSGLRRLTDGLDPVWSPDGTQVALSRWRDPRGVWIVQADGGAERRLFDWSETRTPAWSPDGSRIAFVRQHGGRLEEVEKCFWQWCFTLPPEPHWVLGILNVADGHLSEPPASEVSLAPTWSPDGSRLVYHGRQGLMWTDLTDNSSGHFASSSGWDTSPHYSPDGTQIVFMDRVHTQWEILVMNADGSGRRQLTHSGSQGEEPHHSVAPAWSPDGRQIAFLSNREGPWRIYVMNADGSQQRAMFGSQLDGLGLQYGFASERVLSWSR